MAKQILMSSPFGQSLLDFDVVTSKYMPKGILYMVDPPKPFSFTHPDGLLAQKQASEAMARILDDMSDAYIYGRATPPVRRPWSKTVSWIARDRVMELIHTPEFVALSDAAATAAATAYRDPILKLYSLVIGDPSPRMAAKVVKYEWVEGVGYRRIGRNPHPWR